jgi:hypothetical protein
MDRRGMLGPGFRPILRTLIVVVWGIAAVSALFWLGDYAARPGNAGRPAENWPVESRIERESSCPNLFVWAHPRCPCSEATLAELEEVVARGCNRVAVWVVFIKPAAVARDWERSALWRKATSISGVRVIVDEQCVEAERFGVETSGHVTLYDKAGGLYFSGGITPFAGPSGK